MSGGAIPQRPPIRFRPYAFHFFSALAVSSMAIHVLNQRKASDDERQALTAKTTILEELVTRLRSGQGINTEEVDRLLNLANSHVAESGMSASTSVTKALSKDGVELGWRDAVFGKKAEPRNTDEDMAKLRRELEEAFSERPQPTPEDKIAVAPRPKHPIPISGVPTPAPGSKPPTFY
ncbi:hypothetical protein FRB98_006676 [Tulasnella sp. 332]|nr:hypothetical protein FRB98_006676 [Tulasnella sp. 332]